MGWIEWDTKVSFVIALSGQCCFNGRVSCLCNGAIYLTESVQYLIAAGSLSLEAVDKYLLHEKGGCCRKSAAVLGRVNMVCLKKKEEEKKALVAQANVVAGVEDHAFVTRSCCHKWEACNLSI